MTKQSNKMDSDTTGEETAVADEQAGTNPMPQNEQLPVYCFCLDNSPARGILQELAARGHQIERFSDASSLMRALSVLRPMAILADAGNLPHMQAIKTELGKLAATSGGKIPLIFVSSATSLELRVDAIHAGADAFFSEPFNVSAMADRVQELADLNGSTPFRVLVVEDDKTQADFARAILNKAGIQTQIVTEPLRVMSALESYKPDLILMDLYMPNVNGLELTAIIRDFNEYIATPIIFVSGEHNEEKQLNALSVGGDDFITKPIRPKQLLNVINHRIRRSKTLISALSSTPADRPADGLLSEKVFFDHIANNPVPADQHAAILHIRPDQIEAMRNQMGQESLDSLHNNLLELITGNLQPQDFAMHTGDGGIALMLKRDSEKSIQDKAIDLNQTIRSKALAPAGWSSPVTASIGICFLHGGKEDVTKVATRAEHACREVQAKGGGGIATYSSETEQVKSKKKADLSPAGVIRSALQKDTLLTLYQPVIRLTQPVMECYEVICKIRMPNGELYGERALRPAAKEAGLQLELDQWAAKKAIGLLKSYRKQDQRCLLFIHQSAASVLDKNYPKWLEQQLMQHDLSGKGLVLDFRLSDVSKDLRLVKQHFNALQKLGVEISLSRFSEKPAAFKVLQFLNANYISVAPRLLKAERQIIAEFISSAHKLQAKVIVANVDNPRSIDLHWSAGADFLQGDFIQRPLENRDYDFRQVNI